jgi:hypothetical protein
VSLGKLDHNLMGVIVRHRMDILLAQKEIYAEDVAVVYRGSRTVVQSSLVRMALLSLPLLPYHSPGCQRASVTHP